MDTPIKPRVNKPRVTQRLLPVLELDSNYRYKSMFAPRYVCSDGIVVAKGSTIEGAYKNWVSLCIDKANHSASKYMTAAIEGMALADSARLFLLSQDRDYK